MQNYTCKITHASCTSAHASDTSNAVLVLLSMLSMYATCLPVCYAEDVQSLKLS